MYTDDVVSTGDECGRHDRPPASSTDRVDERSEESERRQMRRDLARRKGPKRLEDDDAPHHEKVRGHVGPQAIAGEVNEDGGAEHRSQDSGKKEPAQERPVDVAEGVMRNGRSSGREALGRMHGGARRGGRNPERQEHGRSGHAVRHSERPVDELREKASEHVAKEVQRHEVQGG